MEGLIAVTCFADVYRGRRVLVTGHTGFKGSWLAQALVKRSYADRVTTCETNIMGMVNLLEYVRTRPWIEVAVLITSDKAYRNVVGYREADALGGHDPYSGSKSCADLVAQSCFHSFLGHTTTRVATTRAGNVIGGGDWADDRVKGNPNFPSCGHAKLPTPVGQLTVSGSSVRIRPALSLSLSRYEFPRILSVMA